MTCEKCGSENVNVQMVSETSIKPKSKGFLWWLFIGLMLATQVACFYCSGFNHQNFQA